MIFGKQQQGIRFDTTATNLWRNSLILLWYQQCRLLQDISACIAFKNYGWTDKVHIIMSVHLYTSSSVTISMAEMDFNIHSYDSLEYNVIVFIILVLFYRYDMFLQLLRRDKTNTSIVIGHCWGGGGRWLQHHRSMPPNPTHSSLAK